MGSKLILHIGTHKTGTTALQAALAANGDILSVAGYAYPLMPEKWPHIKQDRNAYWLSMAALQKIGSSQTRHPGKIPACLESFEETVATKPETVILSDERMWYCGTKKGYWQAMRQIVEQAGITAVRVVVYLRRQDLFAESLWAQYVKGNTRLEQSLDTYMAKPKTIAVCDYAAGIKRLQSVFGADNITVRIYDRDELVGGDTVTDFLAVLGIETTEGVVRPAFSANSSLSPTATVLKLALNQTSQYKNASSNYLLPVLLSASGRDEQRRASFMEPEQRKAFLARYEKGNAQIAQEFFGRDELFALRGEDLEQEAFKPDAGKLAALAAQVIVEANQRKDRSHATVVSKLEARISELEQRDKSRFASRVKRCLKGIARRLGARPAGEATPR